MKNSSATLPARPTPGITGPSPSIAKKGTKRHISLGIFLFALLITQYFIPIQWEQLARLQSDELYKQLSGFAILCFVILQWRLAHLRSASRSQEARQNLNTHQWLGVLAPVLIFIHSTQTGHEHQTALLGLFIATILTGLFSFHTVKIRKQWFIVGWTILHITLATMVIALMAFHIYVVFWYS